MKLEGKQLGNYDVIKRIRIGGMGAVYEGRQRTAFDRRVAIKVILGDFASDRDMRRRFAREARTIARLQHPHILPLIEFGDEQGILYLVMPFIDGGTLTNYLRHHLPNLDEVASIYTQLLDAIEYAHEEGLIHRDIKSSNVLLETRRSGLPHVYLADFGLVRTMRPDADSQVGKPIPLDQVPGTPHYMAPEQTRGIVTTRTDIYALGVLLYQMLTGSLPYNDPDEVRVIQMHMHSPIPLPSQVDGSIPRELDTVVRGAMAKRAEDRYADISTLRIAFLNALHGPTPEMLSIEEFSPAPELPPPPPPVRRKAVTLPMPPVPSPADEPADPADPKPLVLPQRLHKNEGMPVVLREARERARNTDSVQQKHQRSASTVVRITEEPPTRRPRRLFLPIVIISALVTLSLIALLVVPHVMNVSLLPGNPLGEVTIATVSISPDQQTLEDSFLLLASTTVQGPDVEKRSIPARTIQEKASTTETVDTTGSRTEPATYAQGPAVFTNQGDNPVTVNTDQVFVANNAAQFRVKDAVTVPPRQEISAQIEAVETGEQGNIGARTLNTKCCDDALSVSNPQALRGGQDERTVQIVTEEDVKKAAEKVKGNLEKQIREKLEKQFKDNEEKTGEPAYKMDATPNIAVNEPADKVQVAVTVQGSVTVFDRTVAEQTAYTLLEKQAKGKLAEGYTLRGTVATVTSPKVSEHKDNGVYLSVRVRGIWGFTLTEVQLEKWRKELKGQKEGVAQIFLEEQPGVAKVTIQLPDGEDKFPQDEKDIRIVIQ